MRILTPAALIAAAFLLAGCFEGPQGPAGAARGQGRPRPGRSGRTGRCSRTRRPSRLRPGRPAGPKGDKGDAGAATDSKLRVIALGASDCSANGCTVTCEANEVIASAVCAGDTPMQPTVAATSAKCGPAKAMNAICARK